MLNKLRERGIPIRDTYGVPAHEILRKAGEHGYVGAAGRHDLDIAVQMAADHQTANA